MNWLHVRSFGNQLIINARNKIISICILGKHPVSALSELCSKRKWGQADYKLISDAGPPSSKNFLFMVTVNGQDFSPLSPSPNKKNAKAQAATVALQKLGLIA